MDNVKLLDGLSFSELTQLNEAVFRWLEKNVDKFAAVSDDAAIFLRDNLIYYYDWFEAQNKKELQAHFASLVSAERYPHALNFISKTANGLYQKLLELSSEM